MAKVPKKEAREIALNAVFKEFFTAIVAILLEDKSQKEVNYVKVPITMPNGGNYLISILHIDGPKMDLDLLRLVSQSQQEAKDEKDVSKNPV